MIEEVKKYSKFIIWINWKLHKTMKAKRLRTICMFLKVKDAMRQFSFVFKPVTLSYHTIHIQIVPAWFCQNTSLFTKNLKEICHSLDFYWQRLPPFSPLLRTYTNLPLPKLLARKEHNLPNQRQRYNDVENKKALV